MDESELPVVDGVGTDRVRSAVLHQLPWYVVAYEGPEHRALTLNAEQLRVYGGFDPIGMRAADYLIGSEAQGIIEVYDRAYAGEQELHHRVDVGVVTPGGHQEQIVLDFEVAPFRDRHGTVVGIIGVGRDITAAVRREEAEAAAAAELGRRYRRATDVIEEVQRALLPSRLPVLPTVDLAASYVVGGAEQAAGGDWFDVLPLPDGSVAAVVGDVVGHGVAASAVMSQLRAVTLERLHAGATPAEVVSALDRFVEVVPDARSATVCVLHLHPGRRTGGQTGEDTGGGSFEYCTAGHPPPLVVHPDGAARYLDPVPAPPLGDNAPHTPRATSADTLAPGELVLLYTDGILERPGVAVTAGTVELAQIAAAAAADQLVPIGSSSSVVDRVTTQTLERLTRFTGSADDITLLALRPVAPVAPLHVATDLTRTGLPAVRTAVRGWLGPDRVDPRAGDQLDEVVSELCENVVDHAYPGADGGPLTLTADLDPTGQVTLTVADRGRWQTPQGPSSGRGLGLAIAQHFADHLRVDHTDKGTTVTATYRPWKTSHSTALATPAPAVAEMFDIHPEHYDDHTLVKVRGPVDATTVPELGAVLALEVTPGRPLLVVDLDQVTLLASAAVHTLRRTLEAAHAAGVTVDLRAAPSSIAHHVMALVGIDTATAAGL